MPFPAARMTDTMLCPLVTPPPPPPAPPAPHVGGPIMMVCAPTVIIGNMPAARLTDMCLCMGFIPNPIVMGSPTVITFNMPQARIMDPNAHGGMVMTGFLTVIVGP